MGACPELADVVPLSAINGAIPGRGCRYQGWPLEGFVEGPSESLLGFVPSGSSSWACLRGACRGQISLSWTIICFGCEPSSAADEGALKEAV
jgi:hypothetical protein